MKFFGTQTHSFITKSCFHTTVTELSSYKRRYSLQRQKYLIQEQLAGLCSELLWYIVLPFSGFKCWQDGCICSCPLSFFVPIHQGRAGPVPWLVEQSLSTEPCWPRSASFRFSVNRGRSKSHAPFLEFGARLALFEVHGLVLEKSGPP